MADVRSLLRNERASRRITHPAASYSESGKLLCNICVMQIKTESLWDNHIKSPQHALQAQRTRDNSAHGKKRKANDGDDGDDDDGRKRAKAVASHDFVNPPGPELDVTSVDADVLDAIIVDNPSTTELPTLQQPPTALHQPASAAPVASIDEDEWAAFERDLAATQPPPAAISAAAVISAAPLTAEEIAAQAREEQSTQRDKRQAEIEAENEDAEQALQDEFDEMEELEVRVRKLREKREALRLARDGAGDDEVLPDVVDSVPSAAVMTAPEEEDDDDDDDEFDDWKFGAN